MNDATKPTGAPDAGRHGQRLMLNVREVRDRMRLRLIASLPAFAGGLWLLWIGDNTLLRLLAGAGVVFATLWLVLARRSVRQLAHAGDHSLDIGSEGLTLKNGAQSSSWAWSDIDAVEIDEDRLAVRLRVRGAAPVAIEPHYGELGLRELAEAIERARQAR